MIDGVMLNLYNQSGPIWTIWNQRWLENKEVPMVEKGEKLFLVTRRLFETDLRRHFVGEVMEVSSATVRVRGYAFVFDDVTKEFVRRIDLRTRIFSLIDAGVMVSILPQEVILKDIRYSFEDGSRILTDGKLLKMNVSEFGATR